MEDFLSAVLLQAGDWFGLVLILLLVVTIALIVGALVDIVRGKFPAKVYKVFWIAIIFLFPVLGAILYFIVGRKQRTDVSTS